MLKVSNLISRTNHHGPPPFVASPSGQVRTAVLHPPPVAPSRRPTAAGTPLLTWRENNEYEPHEDCSGRVDARHPSTHAGRRRHRGRLATTVPARPLPSISREGGATSTKAEKGACSAGPLIQVHFPHTGGVLTHKKNLNEVHAFGPPKTTDRVRCGSPGHSTPGAFPGMDPPRYTRVGAPGLGLGVGGGGGACGPPSPEVG